MPLLRSRNPLLILAGTFAVLATTRAASAADGVHVIETRPEAAALRRVGPGAVKAVRLVLDEGFDLRRAATVQIDAFGRPLRIQRDRFTPRDGGWTWQGPVNEDEGWAQFVYQEGRLAGSIDLAPSADAIEIVPLPEGGSALVERDSRALPPEAQPIVPTLELADDVAFEFDDKAVLAGITYIDAVVGYTGAVATAAGSHAAVSAQAHADVEWLNQAFRTNGMSMQFRLLAVKRLTTLAENPDSGVMLAAFRDSTEAQGWRNRLGADVMALYMADPTNVCGRGYLMRNPSPAFAPNAYQITSYGCRTSYAHEHGHNMGMEHNPEDSDVGATPELASRPYSFGHGVSDGEHSFRTVMSYTTVCGAGNPCPRVQAFSTPTRTVYGHPIGISGQRHNARTANDHTKQIVAAFRPSQVIFQNGFQ